MQLCARLPVNCNTNTDDSHQARVYIGTLDGWISSRANMKIAKFSMSKTRPHHRTHLYIHV